MPHPGLGAVLLQEQENGTEKRVAYASRSMISTEQRYTEIGIRGTFFYYLGMRGI